MRYSLKGIILAVITIISCIFLGVYFFYFRESKGLANAGVDVINDVDKIVDNTELDMYTTERLRGANVAIAVEKLKADYDVIVQINTKDKTIDYDTIDSPSSGVKIKFTSTSSSDDLNSHLQYTSSEWINPGAEFQGRKMDLKKNDGVVDTIIFTQMTEYSAPVYDADDVSIDILNECLQLQEAATNVKVSIKQINNMSSKWNSIGTNLEENVESAYGDMSTLFSLEATKNTNNTVPLDDKLKNGDTYVWSGLSLHDTSNPISNFSVCVDDDYTSSFISPVVEQLYNGVDDSQATGAAKIVKYSDIKTLDETELKSYYYLRNGILVPVTNNAAALGYVNDLTSCYSLSNPTGKFQFTGRYKSYSTLAERIAQFCDNTVNKTSRDSVIISIDDQADDSDTVYANLNELFDIVNSNLDYAINILTHVDKSNSSYNAELDTARECLNKASAEIDVIKTEASTGSLASSSNPALNTGLLNYTSMFTDIPKFNDTTLNTFESKLLGISDKTGDGCGELQSVVENGKAFNQSINLMKTYYTDFHKELVVLCGSSGTNGLLDILNSNIISTINKINSL